MKEEINKSRFMDRFREMNRDNNFTYDGKSALYNYLIELEEDTGTELDIDIIALCCDYNEYKDLDEYLNDYDTDLNKDDFEGDIEGYQEAVIEEIQQKTILIPLGDNPEEDGFIIQAY